MALSPTSEGFVAASGLDRVADPSLPIFNIERVQLQFGLSAAFVGAQVANNVLILALATGRILRIDLDSPAEIDDIDLPKKVSEIGVIRKLFLDPSASHLIINTALGENYYLHSQARQPRVLSRLKGVNIESVAWNTSLPTASTREILIGASDGNVYETHIEPSTEFYRREEKYVKAVYKIPDGAVVGLWTGLLDGRPDVRRVIIASQTRLLHFSGRLGRHGQEGSGSVYSRLLETETPTVQDGPDSSSRALASLFLAPDPEQPSAGDRDSITQTWGWLTGQGVRYGSLSSTNDLRHLEQAMFSQSKLVSASRLRPSSRDTQQRKKERPLIQGAVLTEWHVVVCVSGRIMAFNRLSEELVFEQQVFDQDVSILGMLADSKKSTYWLFTAHEIYEIGVEDEDRDIWKIMLTARRFDEALKHAKGDRQKDAVATASGDYLIEKRQFPESAEVYGKSSKPFEEVALTYIDHSEQDALRRYLLVKLDNLKKSFSMQRTMLASWLVELFMAKMNSLDDTITTEAELVANADTASSKVELQSLRDEYVRFITRNKGDLDTETTYNIINAHGREQELLAYATAVEDSRYILNYWVRRERWRQALDVLKKCADPDIFYKYSTVLMSNAPAETVDILMRHTDLDSRKLVPAMLNYAENKSIPLSQNQAVRFLAFCIDRLASTDAAIHNTLISVYASDSSPSEDALLAYLSAQATLPKPYYDLDFALRLCIQHNRIQSCVHIYSLMSQYEAAVQLALKHDQIDLASIIADRPAETNPALRKKLWLAVARKVISQPHGGAGSIKTAVELLQRCDLLRIEDLLPFFPDFVVIDSFKDEICAALESYSRHIGTLRSEMDDATDTAARIREDIDRLDARYAVVLPGEKCRLCKLPLLSRQFFVFPSCQHGFHSDCLGRKVVEASNKTDRNRIRELQGSIGRGVSGPRREREVQELDGLVGRECILCSDYAIKLTEVAFITEKDDLRAWEVQ